MSVDVRDLVPCTLTLDLPFQPQIGDIARSTGGSLYRIIAVRRVKSTVSNGRYRLTCQRNPTLLRTSHVFDFTWYAR